MASNTGEPQSVGGKKCTAADTNAEPLRGEIKKERKEDTKAETLQRLLGSKLASHGIIRGQGASCTVEGND